jgi:hypothetical protein
MQPPWLDTLKKLVEQKPLIIIRFDRDEWRVSIIRVGASTNSRLPLSFPLRWRQDVSLANSSKSCGDGSLIEATTVLLPSV